MIPMYLKILGLKACLTGWKGSYQSGFLFESYEKACPRGNRDIIPPYPLWVYVIYTSILGYFCSVKKGRAIPHFINWLMRVMSGKPITAL